MRERYHRKNKKNLLWGAWPPNLTPDPHVPQDLSSAHRGAHDPEKTSEIAQAVAEKIEFEKKNFAPPGGQTGSNCGHVIICEESYRQGLESVKISRP